MYTKPISKCKSLVFPIFFYFLISKQEYWVNENGEQATRDELMTLLTDVETFLVRAAYLPGPSVSTLVLSK